MSIEASVSEHDGQHVRANGIDVHFLDVGDGAPLLAPSST
jgi:hypothetical protein